MFVRRGVKMAGKMLFTLKEKQNRRSLCLALAGTLGVGNIVGVAIGIIVGGAGSVFWIFISGFFSSVIKYCESSLARDMSNSRHGGMHYVIRSSFGRAGRALSFLYAALCLFLSLTMGSMMQSKAVADSLEGVCNVPRSISAAVFAFLIIILIRIGVEKIEQFTEIAIPLTTMVYIMLALSVILVNHNALGGVMRLIFRGAFSPDSALGGALGVFTSNAMREGFARGLLSNEAGAGTSAMAQSRAEGEPCIAGLMGMCEVFFDTTLLCTVTGIAILSAVPNIGEFESGTDIIIYAINGAIGSVGTALLPPLIILFAYSTVICWYFYGCECLEFIAGKQGGKLYMLLFAVTVLLGAILPMQGVVVFIDYLLLFMTALTAAALIKNSERIVRLSELGGLL